MEIIQMVSDHNKNEFSKDFKTGCFAIVLFFLIVFIVIPFLAFVFKLGLALAIPLITIVIIIFLIAFLGKIINFFRKSWR